MMLTDCYKAPEHQRFLEGIQALEQPQFMRQAEPKHVYLFRQVEQQNKTLMETYTAQQTKMGDNEDSEQMKKQASGLPFWRLVKELTLLGYFTSEAGLRVSFEYTPIPGKLEVTKLTPTTCLRKHVNLQSGLGRKC